MNRTIFLLGPADPQFQEVGTTEAAENGLLRREVDLSGVLPILPFITNDRKLKPGCTCVIVGEQQINLSRGTRVNLFNMVGDADSSRLMLRNIQEIAGRIQPLRCFNHPTNVFRTSRENLPKTLASIPNCRVAAVKAVDATSFDELESACRAFGKWPLILRARGYHGGKHMVLLHKTEELGSIRDIQWLYDGILLIEYIDCQTTDGLYQKNRVVMVDGEPYARHSIYSDRWSIHSESRSDLMDHNRELCQQEKQFLAHMSDTGLQEYRDIFEQIHERIGLDIFGIDFALVDNKIIVFEANACMNILSQDYGEDDRYRYLEQYVKALKRAIKKMLLRA